MFSLTRLFIIIITFCGMTDGCAKDRFGDPVMLETDSNTPHRLESDCWYSVSASSTQHVIAVTERPSADEKLTISWENINEPSLFTILFDWDSIPYYNIARNVHTYDFFVSEFDEDGHNVYPLDPNGHDIYHCIGSFGCNNFKKDPHVGDLYIKFVAFGTETLDTGRFKISWQKPMPFIQANQLSVIKNMWTGCCAPIYVHPDNVDTITTKIDYKNIFTKLHCDLSLPHNLTIDSLTTQSCEDIDFITCDKDGNVIGLYVSNSGLKCDNFINYVSKLPKLVELFATTNSLSGDLNQLSVLESLESVALTDNLFTGDVPCFPNTGMVSLELGMNKLSGRIPSCIEKLTVLNVLDLSDNPFGKQNFPHFIKMLNSLEFLDLSNTNLHGEIDNVFNFPSLELLDISANHLTGKLPVSLVLSNMITHLDVSFNYFTGIIPKLSDKLVTGLYSMNSFYGDVLHVLGSSPLNAIIDISHNKFFGLITDEVIKTMITKNIVVNMKGNSFDCNPETESWSKSVLHMNSILQLGKCGNDHNPCHSHEDYHDYEPCEQCEPCEKCKHTEIPATPSKDMQKPTSLSTQEENVSTRDTLMWVLFGLSVMAGIIVTVGCFYYKYKYGKNIYVPTVETEELVLERTDRMGEVQV